MSQTAAFAAMLLLLTDAASAQAGRGRSQNSTSQTLPEALVSNCTETGGNADQRRRVALVIGNGAYTRQPLANPGNDAKAIAGKLGELGFRVIVCQNLAREGMQQALQRLRQAAQGSEIAAVYFAGHGAERRGKNYLIPTDARLEHASDLGLEAIALDDVLDRLAGATKLRLVLLDACRNNPFPLAGEDRSATRGLTRPPEEDNTLIAYAAEAGTLAADGAGQTNSPFTAALLRHMATPGLDVRLMLGSVRDDVSNTTGGRQRPSVYGTLGGDVVVLAAATGVAATTQQSSKNVTSITRGWELTPQVGHTHSVRTVTYSPDGRFIISGGSEDQFGRDNTVRVWEAATGQLVRMLDGHTSNVNSVVVSPDGRLIVSGSADSTLRVWEAATGRLVRMLEGHKNDVKSVVVSPDGRLIVSGSADNTLKVWEAPTGRLVRTIEGHTSDVNSVAVSPDTRFIVSSSADNSLKVWEVTTGRLVRTIEDETSNSVVMSRDGHLIIGSSGDAVKVWEASTGRLVRTIEGHTSNVSSVAVSPDVRLIVSGSADNSLKIWEVSTGRLVRTIKGHTNDVLSVAFSPDGRLIVSGSADETLNLWEVSTGRGVRKFERKTGAIQALAVSSNGQLIVGGNSDSVIRVWDAFNGRLVREIGISGDIPFAVAVSPDGRFIFSGGWEPTVKVWEISTGRLVRKLEGKHRGGVTAVAVSPDGRIVVGGTQDTAIQVWEVSSGRLIRSIKWGDDIPFAVAVSPDGAFVLSRGLGKSVKRWSLSSGREAETQDWDGAFADNTRNPKPYTFEGTTIRSLAPDGSTRFRIATLRDGHWIAIGTDGVTFTGSRGAERHLLLSARDRLETRRLDDADIKQYRRDLLDLR